MESQLRIINDLHIHEIRLTSVTRMRSFLSMQRKLVLATAFPESTGNFFFLTLTIEGSNIVYHPFFFFPVSSSGQHKETSFFTSLRS